MEHNKIERKRTTCVENVSIKSDRLWRKIEGQKELIFQIHKPSLEHNSLMCKKHGEVRVHVQLAKNVIGKCPSL